MLECLVDGSDQIESKTPCAFRNLVRRFSDDMFLRSDGSYQCVCVCVCMYVCMKVLTLTL